MRAAHQDRSRQDAEQQDFRRLLKKLLEKWTPVTENLVARGLCNGDLYKPLES
jgi:hypothetical protein